MDDYDFMESEYDQDQEVLREVRSRKKSFDNVINKKSVNQFELDDVMS